MNNTRLTTILLSSAFAGAVLLAGCRHRRPEGPPPPREPAGDPPIVQSSVERNYARTMKQLDMTEAQKKEVKAAYGNYFTKVASVKFSDESQGRKLEKIRTARAELDRTMKAVLTEAQYIQYHKIIDIKPAPRKGPPRRRFRPDY
ncbi:hypothetical protein P0136_05240 [Lentisphaerota bacterium ZTH]|nr:hypothetical protein JYG24_03645 [Lentisphaerota bacterium]WET07395.1 hypothetical protein P0136_05240 [Lentisphaerota bacterium ZTH]